MNQITHVTEQWLTDRVNQMPYWGPGNKWQYHYGTVRVPAGICINFTQEWLRPSRVCIEFERPAYKEFNCQPDKGSEAWWRDNPGKFLINQVSQGGDAELDGTITGVGMRGSWPKGEPVSNCLRILNDDEWKVSGAFYDYLEVGVEAYNVRRGKFESCKFLGDLMPATDISPPTSTGLRVIKGNAHLDTCFFQRNEKAVSLNGVEQHTDINLHFENNQHAYIVSGCKGFKNCGLNTIRSSLKHFLIADNNAFRDPEIHCNLQAIYAGHTEEGGRLKRIPSPTAGIKIGGKEYELVHSGASRVDGHETARFPKPLDVSGIIEEQNRYRELIEHMRIKYVENREEIMNLKSAADKAFSDIAKLDSRSSAIEAAVIHLNEIRDAIHEATK